MRGEESSRRRPSVGDAGGPAKVRRVAVCLPPLGMTEVETLSDGYSLFDAMSKGLESAKRIKLPHFTVRAKVVCHMRKDRNLKSYAEWWDKCRPRSGDVRATYGFPRISASCRITAPGEARSRSRRRPPCTRWGSPCSPSVRVGSLVPSSATEASPR